MPDLIELQRKYLLETLESIQTPHNIKFLVIDEYTGTLFESLFVSANDLLNYVTSIEKIDARGRKGQSSVEVIYMLQPTKYNINCISADFYNRDRKYSKAHIRFLPGMENHIANFLRDKKTLQPFIASMNEIKLAFAPKETQFFQTLDIDKPFQIFYNKSCVELIEKNINKTIESLINICIVTGEYPIIRYAKALPHEVKLSPATRLAEKLAVQFQEALDSYVRDHQDFPPPSSRPRAIFIITERSLDQFAPILHDFNYQAMAYDLVPDIDRDDVYHYKAENEAGDLEEKSSKLADLIDPDWVDLKHLHIIDANEQLSGKIKELIAKNPLLVDRSKVKNTTDLLSVVAHLKDFDEDRRRIMLHKILIESCLKINQERQLTTIAEVEQNLAGFGLNIDGEKCKHIIDTVLTTLLTKECNITDKIRLLIAYALFRGGLIESDFLKLLSFIGVREDHEFFPHFILLFKNFDNLGFKLIKENARDKPFHKAWFHDTIVKDPNIYVTSRYVPAVGNILSKVIANPLLLSEEEFPYVKDKPIDLLDDDEREAVGAAATAQSSSSLRNSRHKAAWSRNGNSLKNEGPRQRFFYYVLGGITYSEIRAAYDQSNLKNKDVFIGSDGVLKPVSFLRSVENLTQPREVLNLNDDRKVKDDIPSFLMGSNMNAPVSHVHSAAQYEVKKNIIPIVQSPPMEESTEKHKKRSKFKKFLKKMEK
ncbi:Sec1p [Maudiozyma barnettii]|uniref:Similar to Saccharomyces cerevisiae YDR164C SEC1 Sm-like protein involved in docking and fusion of exocytic vesicles n=1 Tax=Maudiozyma barnettii TaxID=61262 RepID=A0A8H2ZI96_9SACH|nr:Sec1p [Kazachstania barnettii]CAB4255668.1 similar to Saccharomyces cerevisiae YDR164C SEC1 Sm-like protein involved in docking and fusion of exocytic vesicles [Kazachstania barnettii]